MGFGLGPGRLGVCEELFAFVLKFRDSRSAKCFGFFGCRRADDRSFLFGALGLFLGFAKRTIAYVVRLLLGEAQQLCCMAAKSAVRGAFGRAGAFLELFEFKT